MAYAKWRRERAYLLFETSIFNYRLSTLEVKGYKEIIPNPIIGFIS